MARAPRYSIRLSPYFVFACLSFGFTRIAVPNTQHLKQTATAPHLNLSTDAMRFVCDVTALFQTEIHYGNGDRSLTPEEVTHIQEGIEAAIKKVYATKSVKLCAVIVTNIQKTNRKL